MPWPHYDRIDRQDQLIAAAGAIPFIAIMALVAWCNWAPGGAS